MNLGCLNYINVLPITHALPEVLRAEQPGAPRLSPARDGRPGNPPEGRGREAPPTPELIYGEPSALNAMLAEGAIDASLISSIEYARHQDEYVVLPDLSISSHGNTKSVVLFSWLPLNELNGEVIGACAATATSSVLLQVLLEDFSGVHAVYQARATVEEFEAGDFPALLLIGDEALHYRATHGNALYEYDLGAMWKDASGLPMVFALWAARVTEANREGLRSVQRALVTAREQGLRLPDGLLHDAERRTGLDEATLREYYAGLSFDLPADAVRGLLAFYERAAARGLCAPCKALRFLEMEPAYNA
ncbi:MAG: menaquinone biosynthesis protein [Armatimonadetes bacterium]|nr:menaquinone biosynthesis protein [Armatimonadota bacterium]